MLIDILGVGTRNKGAELMLAAILSHMKSHYSKISFASEPMPPFFEMHCQYDLYQKIWFYVRGMQVGRLGRLIPKQIRHRFGLITEEEINAVFDASGFAYGDQWPNKKMQQRIANHITRWKKQGKKVILLPQAFGPFEKIENANTMKKVLNNADLVFARDNISFNYLTQLAPNSSNIFRAPDFTNLLKGTIPEYHDQNECRIAFIPNSKMLKMTKDNISNQYIDIFVSGINQCLATGKKPFILVHESHEDNSLAKKITGLINVPIQIVKPISPLDIKGIIGTCDLVVSSRFHGLVSALSQGVPVIATGWSHKYKELLADYSCSELIIPVEKEAMISILTNLFDKKYYASVKQKIEAASDIQKEAARNMWEKVENCLSELDC